MGFTMRSREALKRDEKPPYWPLLRHQNTRSRPVQLFSKQFLSLQFNFGRDAETVRRIPTGEPRTHYVDASMLLSSVPGSVWPAQRDSLSDVQASVREVLVLWLGFLPSSAVTKMLVRPGTV